MAQTVLTDPLEVYSRLYDLQLPEEVLIAAVSAGLAAKANCTNNYPTNFPGMAMWAEIVRRLRDGLIPSGWTAVDSKGLPLVVRGDGLVAVCVASGDEGTGCTDDSMVPSNRHRKGVATAEVVERNLDLPFDDVAEREAHSGPMSTWFLLHYRKGTEIICELSHPVSMNASGFVDEWDERIILTPISLDPARMPVLDTPRVEADVTVRRREA